MNNTIGFYLLILLSFSALASENQSTENLPELDGMTKSAMKRTVDLTTDQHGQMSVDTSNSFRSVTFVRIGENGKNETLCTTNELEARKFLAGTKNATQNDGE